MEAKQELKYIFANIIEWLKFAEAKHGGLIILNSGIVIGILSSYSNIYQFLFKPTLLIGFICFGISILMSIISQFPVTQNIFYNKKDVTNPNLYFFGHLSHFDNQTFVEELQKADNNYSPTRMDNDLINQILINARIASAKFNIFKFATYITTLGLGLISVSSIIKILWHL